MTLKNKQSGFSAIELMITLFIAVSFFTTGFQIYSLITTDGDETRSRNRANNIVYDYLQRYKPDTTTACTAATPVNNQAITAPNLFNVNVTVNITCQTVGGINLTKETVTVNYGTPQKTTTSTVVVNSKPIDCPAGFIVVPGSKTYNTSDFCVMKYEAKKVGATTVPISTAAVTPWTAITHTNAINYSTSVAGCTGCHLITEAEWMTIAQNVLSVGSNWSTGTVGSGTFFKGHNDNQPNVPLAADTNDNNGYYLETNVGGTQRRTLTLTNGEVIWDFAGNVSEFTADISVGGQPGIIGQSGYTHKQFYLIDQPGSLAVNITPVGTGLYNASSWNNTNNIGQLYSDIGDGTAHVFSRGGAWPDETINAGVLTALLNSTSGTTCSCIGFRVAR